MLLTKPLRCELDFLLRWLTIGLIRDHLIIDARYFDTSCAASVWNKQCGDILSSDFLTSLSLMNTTFKADFHFHQRLDYICKKCNGKCGWEDRSVPTILSRWPATDTVLLICVVSDGLNIWMFFFDPSGV